MLDSILSLLASGGATGIVGLVGGLFQRHVDLKAMRVKADMEKVRLEYRHKEVQTEASTQLRLQRVSTEAEIERDMIAADTASAQLSSDDYRAALKSDKATYSKAGMQWWHPLVWVDAAKGMVRIVVVLWTLWLLHSVMDAVGVLQVVGGLSAEQQFEMVMHIVNGVIQLAFLTTGFYFGQRAPAPSKHHTTTMPTSSSA